MMSEWVLLFATATSLSAIGFICVAVIWLRKLRETVALALSEAAGQQIRTAQRHNQLISQLQKQHDTLGQQVHTLAQAGLRLQHEISNVSNKLESAQDETPMRRASTVH